MMRTIVLAMTIPADVRATAPCQAAENVVDKVVEQQRIAQLAANQERSVGMIALPLRLAQTLEVLNAEPGRKNAPSHPPD